ncbi:MAG: TRAP transporter substrate-binding protein [Lentihominibacter sp.]|jgi:tripartite ATP-independent transporter DctP family solute receptor
MKRLFKIVLPFAISFVMVFTFASCGDSNDSDAGKPIEFVVAHVDPDDSVMGENFLWFEEYVEENTDGQVDVVVNANGSLGGEREIVESIQMGDVHLSLPALSVLSTYDEKFNIFEIPFVLDDYDAFIKAYDGEVGDMVKEWATEYGFQIYGWAPFGFRGLSNSVREVKTPADIEGLKIRCIESDMYLKMFKDIGANPTPMSFSEIYTALQQGTIDGQDNPPEITYTSKFAEVQNYYTTLNHVMCNGVYITNADYMANLPEDIRAVIEEGIQGMSDLHREKTNVRTEECLQSMRDDGLTVTELTDGERAQFKALVTGIHDQYKEILGKDIWNKLLECNN